MRTIFNNIISEKNLDPKINTEYIYCLDMIWKVGELESLLVQEGSIVENVTQEDVGNYYFNVKGNPEKYYCSYGWAFVENTLENKELLEQIKKEQDLLSQQEKKIKQLRNKLISLFKDYN